VRPIFLYVVGPARVSSPQVDLSQLWPGGGGEEQEEECFNYYKNDLKRQTHTLEEEEEEEEEEVARFLEPYQGSKTRPR